MASRIFTEVEALFQMMNRAEIHPQPSTATVPCFVVDSGEQPTITFNDEHTVRRMSAAFCDRLLTLVSQTYTSLINANLGSDQYRDRERFAVALMAEFRFVRDAWKHNQLEQYTHPLFDDALAALDHAAAA